ncbi:MAG: MBOAT family protein [Clostridia bacterium]|nr:MBOAT family protein [Clostridia bacterium]
MLFTSLEFLILFLPITTAVYFLLPRDEDAWNVWLLMASLFFYAWGEPTFVLVMLLSIGLNYLFARAMEKREGRKKRFWLVCAVSVNIGLLLVFKYLNFLLSVLRGWLPFAQGFLPQTHIALPIGISFFTFQAVSYVIDVYRGEPAQKSIVQFSLYICFFPQLIAGPIVRYAAVRREIEHRGVSLKGFCRGLTRFMLGFNKKVLLSNVFSEIAGEAFAATSLSAGMAWAGALAFTLQIYFDFSGYSDMAIGLGRMFGFHFMENFDHPYASRTVTEFWRRWHISLGSWFRDYVYFPLGGSRVGKGKLIRNLLIVWCLTGIWHGANWTFLMWGLMYGVLIIGEKLLNIPRRIGGWPLPFRLAYRLFTMLTVVLGWVLFNADSLPHALSYLQSMFSPGGMAADGRLLHALWEYRVFWAAGIVGATPLLSRLGKRLTAGGGVQSAVVAWIGGAAQLFLFLVSISCLVMNAHNPFIYFNF